MRPILEIALTFVAVVTGVIVFMAGLFWIVEQQTDRDVERKVKVCLAIESQEYQAAYLKAAVGS